MADQDLRELTSYFEHFRTGEARPGWRRRPGISPYEPCAVNELLAAPAGPAVVAVTRLLLAQTSMPVEHFSMSCLSATGRRGRATAVLYGHKDVLWTGINEPGGEDGYWAVLISEDVADQAEALNFRIWDTPRGPYAIAQGLARVEDYLANRILMASLEPAIERLYKTTPKRRSNHNERLEYLIDPAVLSPVPSR